MCPLSLRHVLNEHHVTIRVKHRRAIHPELKGDPRQLNAQKRPRQLPGSADLVFFVRAPRVSQRESPAVDDGYFSFPQPIRVQILLSVVQKMWNKRRVFERSVNCDFDHLRVIKKLRTQLV